MSSEINDYWKKAYKAALLSSDTNTKVGTCLDGPIRAIGWNYEIAEIPGKLGFVHAEMDVISKSLRTQDTTLYCTWGCCTNCAKLIVISGITKMITAKYDYEKWAQEIEWGHKILRDNGVEIEFREPFGPLLIGGVIR